MASCKLCPNCKMITYTKKCDCGYFGITKFITSRDYFKCYTSNIRHLAYNMDFRYVPGYKEDWTLKIQRESRKLIKQVNALLSIYADTQTRKVKFSLSSGWRPSKYNKEIGGALYSSHQKGQALDIVDVNNNLWFWLNDNKQLLKDNFMAIEHYTATPTWLHIQSVLPRSGNNIFYP